MAELQEGAVNLDETLTVESASLAEGALVQRLLELNDDVVALREELRRLKGGASLTELRLFVASAAELQAKAGIPQHLLKKEALKEAGIPVEEVEEARRLLMAVTATEEAASQCRRCLAEARHASPAFELRQLLESWENLRKAESSLKEGPQKSCLNVDLESERRLQSLRPLCEALLAEVDIAGDDQAWFRSALQNMGVQAAVNAGRDAEGPQLPTRGRPCATGMPAAALAAAAEAAVARSRSPTPPPGIRPASTADMEGSAVRGKSIVLEEEVTFAGPGLSSFIESQREALSRQRQLQAPEREAVPSKAYVEKDSAVSNGLHPKPSMPASAAGSPELWHAVHIGNEALVSRLIQQGQCNGRQKDASGHSVLWHAIAFGHIGIALLMLDSCPAGEPGGVDASEVHPRKGDTFLHLLCQCRPFTKETAGLFKRVAEAVPAALFSKANANGQSFLALAAASLNFWVLKHVALRYPEQMKVLICSTEADQGKPPLRQLLQSLPNPRQPGFPQSAKIPEHFAVASMLSPDSTGRVPFADIAFDVTTGPDTHSRFLAHRVVVGAQSPVLLKELETLPLVELPQEGITAAVFRVDRRISKDVWRAVLQFFYTGMVHCPFVKDPAKLVELFRAAAIYKLPKALLDLAQAALFPLLPSSPGLALEVFSISAGASGEGVDVASLRLASTFVLLGHASTVFADLAPETVSGVLERLLATSEQAIFSAQQEPDRKSVV